MSEDADTESPTKKSRSDGLGILPLQTHQPFRLQVTHISSAMCLLLYKVTSIPRHDPVCMLLEEPLFKSGGVYRAASFALVSKA